MLEMKRFSQLRTSLNFSKENTILRELKGEKMYTDSKTISTLLSFFISGPHKSRECLPLCLILRNRLKYALNYKEVTTILQQRLVKVDGKVRMEKCYPCGIMDVVEIEKTDEHFRLMYDQKGRFVVHRITGIEAQY